MYSSCMTKTKNILALAGAAILGALIVPQAAQSAVNYFDQTKTVSKTVEKNMSMGTACSDSFPCVAAVSCPAGYKMMAGGYKPVASSTSPVYSSYPSGNGWAVRFGNSYQNSAYAGMTVYATCVR